MNVFRGFGIAIALLASASSFAGSLSDKDVLETARGILQKEGFSPKNIEISNPESPACYIAEATIGVCSIFSESAEKAKGSIFEIDYDIANRTHWLHYDCYLTIQPKQNEARIHGCDVSINQSLLVDVAKGLPVRSQQ